MGGEFVGTVEIDDRVKDGAREAVQELKKSGVTYTQMLTGDRKSAPPL